MNTETEEQKPVELDLETKALIDQMTQHLLKREQKKLMKMRVWYDDGDGHKKLISKVEWDALPWEERQRSNNIV
jgi:hypothetical protein